MRNLAFHLFGSCARVLRNDEAGANGDLGILAARHRQEFRDAAYKQHGGEDERHLGEAQGCTYWVH